VPLLLYVVGMADPHVVIGTTSVAVAANAVTALLPHARAGNVRWAVAGVFSAFGVAGRRWDRFSARRSTGRSCCCCSRG
jgi:uncharacterized membrane protein YfcA